MLNAPLFGLLMRMTAPNSIAFLIQSGVSLAEVWIIGQLGTISLAAMALVFPLLMLFQTVATGAFGGAVNSAIARALGRNDTDSAEKLVWQGIFLAFGGALVFLLLFLLGGRAFLTLLGGRGETLALAMQYCWILFLGGIAIWLFGVLSSVFRGGGDMRTPALLMIINAFIQVPLTGGLALGWFGLPQFGMPGAAISGLLVIGVTNIIMLALLIYSAPVRLRLRQCGFDRALTADILSVARPASLNPIMTVATILGLTALVGQFGTEALAGYGIGARIEYIILPVIFGFGTALTTIIGTNVGAKNIDRAETAALYGVICSAAFGGVVGVLLALFPSYWIPAFTDSPAAFDTARQYIAIVGPAYPFLCAGLVLYFASQGAGRMFWPVSAMVLRFFWSLGLASIAIFIFDAPIAAIFWAAATGMALYATIILTAIRRGAWR